MSRDTAQKRAIRAAFEQTGRPLTPQEALDEASRSTPGMGIATVYRNLKRLVEDGWLRMVELPEQGTRYERAELSHHHHFKCNDCDRVFDVPCHVGQVDQHVPAGFQVARHQLILYGRCAPCVSGAV